jgi:hypothetical protein
MDQIGTPAAGQRCPRASHADRDQVADILKAAFVEGRLTQDELEARVGQALLARTHAELATLTADLPARALPAPAPKPLARRPRNVLRKDPRNAAARRAVGWGAAVFAATVAAVSSAAVAVGQPAAAAILAVFMVVVAAVATALVAGLIATVLELESRKRSRACTAPRGTK